MSRQYRTVLVDPPWPMTMCGKRTSRNERPRVLPYPTMRIEDIAALPVGDLAETGAHLWLWVTSQFLEQSFGLIRGWGFKYLSPIVWAKPSGFGNWFVNVTEHLLFAYKGKCQFNQAKYLPNFYEWEEAVEPQSQIAAELEVSVPADLLYKWPRAKHGQHSKKPEGSYRLIESVSDPARIELFARDHQPLLGPRPGWDVWGDQVKSTVQIEVTL